MNPTRRHFAAIATAASLALTSAPLWAAGDAASGHTHAQTQAQGMYSADHLLDASVYAKGDSKDAVGDVQDVLLNNGMTVRSFVIETRGTLGLVGGKSYVVKPDQLTVETLHSKHPSQPNYRVELNLTRDQLTHQPVYSDSWWSKAQHKASQAWQQTEKSASSAWTQVKKTTSGWVDGAHQKASNAASATSKAAQQAGDKAKQMTHDHNGS